MILVGLFSTHLTYLLLAAVYIFGYGAYALNCKKNQCLEKENEVKQITYEPSKTITASFQENDCFYWEDISTYTNDVIVDNNQSVKFDYNLIKNLKAKEHFCVLKYGFNLNTTLFSRPPPFNV